MKLFKVAALFILVGFSPLIAQEQMAIKLTGEECLLAVLQNNFQIKIQGALPLINEQNLLYAESEFDPLLFGKIGDARSRTPSTSAFADPEVGEVTGRSFSMGVKQKLTPGTSYELSLAAEMTETNSRYASLNPQYTPSLNFSLNQPLLKGSGGEVNKTGIVIAKNLKAMSDAEFAFNVMEILTRASEVYWDLVFLYKELAVLEESLERAGDFLARIKLQVVVGALAPIEIAAAEATVAVRKERLIDARYNISNVQDVLKALINKKSAQPGSEVRIEPIDEPKYEKLELKVENLKQAAYENRPDYHAAKLQISNSMKELAYNKNQLRPKIDLQGVFTLKAVRGGARAVGFGNTLVTSSFDGGMGGALGDMTSGKYYDFYVGLIAEYPFYNRASKSRVAKNLLELTISETSYSDIKQAIDIEVLRAVREINTAEQRIHATKASRVLADKKLDAEIQKYEVGASTSFAVLEYQHDLADRKSKEIKAIIDHIKAAARLELATGSVLKNRNILLESAAP
ncbi:MAG: type I secretion outer membrane protein [bacterium]|nr:MAG: type I secretion outer membrane protein [bacterium]